ncbi:MAG TPA: SDR family oxidoreductase [Thermoanaerobaculia bacterium]|nr:SDR family oxidoreductase [Thermoanaerobaculia bacterium]
MSELEGRIAVVTGASSGIGRATAELFAKRGARVAIFARTMEKLSAIAARYEDRMIAVAGDVADLADVERLFSVTEKSFGHCDLLVNNVGMIEPGRLVDTTLESWDRVIAVNLRSAFLASRRALPSMIEQRRGAIVNVASISGVPGPRKYPGFTSYNASKGALIAFTEALAVEVAEHDVRVNCVSPGSVDTPMWSETSGGAPANMTPDEIAETILFLASDRSRPMNGQNLHVYSATDVG